MRRNHLLICLSGVFLLAPILSFAKKPKPALPQGNDLYDRHRYAEAVAAYTRAVEENATDPRGYFDRALAGEMVDRPNALKDWKRFLELAGTDPQWSAQVKLVQERVKVLELMPPLPDLLLPSHYNPKEDDYYRDVASLSGQARWARFPVRIFLLNPPSNWRETAQKALAAWSAVFPLQAVDSEDQADIVVKWGTVSDALEPTGNTEDSEENMVRGETVVTRRRRATVTLDTSHRLSGDEMLSAALHQIGHALGIRGHSARMADVMYLQGQHVYSELQGGESTFNPGVHAAPGVSDQAVTNTKVTQRDINTLVRVYNSPGPLLPLD